jgi:hypothetical protein
MSMENTLEILVKGSLVIIGCVLGLAVAGFIFAILLPFAIGYGIVLIIVWLYNKFRSYFPEPEKKPTPEDLKRMHDKIVRERQKEEEEKKLEHQSELEEKRERQREWRRLERHKVPETAPDEEDEEPKEEPYDLEANLHLGSNLTKRQQEILFTKGYRALKISPFGTSGASYYWLKPRYNESLVHGFFCFILEAELKRYGKVIEMNVTNGPDLVVEHQGKHYCFDVETGKNLSRQPDWLEKKFAYYQKEYEKSFILVTKRTLRYKYSHYGTVITRGKIRETLRRLFRR